MLHFTGGDGHDRRKTGGIGLDYAVGSNLGIDETDSKSMDATQRQVIFTHNRNLIEYFAKLAESKDEDECVNLEYVESLLNSGAKIDCTDKYGQSILHEVIMPSNWYILYIYKCIYVYETAFA